MACYIDNRAYRVVFEVFCHIFAVASQQNSQPKK